MSDVPHVIESRRRVTGKRKFKQLPRKSPFYRSIDPYKKAYHFKNTYRPNFISGSSNLDVDGTSGASYNSTSGLLLGPTGTSDAFFRLRFTFSDTTNQSASASLFDSYMIRAVAVTFLPVTVDSCSVSAAQSG